MRDNTSDQLIMLLSADWFFCYWPAIGISADERTRLFLAHGCRDIVRQIVFGVEEYWLTSFSKGRIQQTQSSFHNLLSASGLQQSTLNKIDLLLSGRTESNLDEKTAWLLGSIAEMLAADSLGTQAEHLAPHIKATVIEAWKRNNASSVDFESLSLKSDSGWDQYLRTLMPDLPTYLADYASSVVAGQSLDALWNVITANLGSRQTEQLIDWFASVSQNLTGEKIPLPGRLI